MLQIQIDIAIAAISALQAVTVAVIAVKGSAANKRQIKLQDDILERARIRAEESRLAMSMMNASLDLTRAIAAAVKEGKVNGGMEAALTATAAAQRSYRDFIDSVARRQMAAAD